MDRSTVFISAALLTGLLLVGCSDSSYRSTTQSFSNTNPGVNSASLARVDFSVTFPDQGEVQASYLDPSMNSIKIEVFNSPFGSFNELKAYWGSTGLNAYMQCLGENYSNPAPCQYQPGSQVATETISRTSPTATFEVPPGKYQINVSQLASSGAVLAQTTSLVTLVLGDNNLNLNMLYGSWNFVQPVQLQLLNALAEDHLVPAAELPLGIEQSFQGAQFSNSNWNRSAEGPDASTPALGLGLAYETGSLQLSRLHLTGQSGLRGWGGSMLYPEDASNSLYFGDMPSYAADLFTSYAQAVVAPHGVTLESSQGGFIGMGWSKNWQNSSGMLEPAFLMQQFVAGSNNTQLNLGQLAVQLDEYSSYAPEAGLFFITADETGDYDLLLYANNQGQMLQGGKFVSLDHSFDHFTDFQTAYLSAYQDTTWVDSNFPAAPFPVTRMTSANSMEGTLIEYVTYQVSSYDNPDLQPLISSISELPNFNTMNPGQEVQIASISPELHQQIQSRIKQRLLTAAQPAGVSASSVHAASTTPGCFTVLERFQSINAGYVLESGVWIPDETANFYPDNIEEMIMRICLHPFTLQASALNNPDTYQQQAKDLGPIQIEHAGELAFEALDVSGNFLINTRLLTLKMLQASNWPVGSAICQSGSVNRTNLGGNSDPSRVKLTFNACQLNASFIVQSGEAILFRNVDGEFAKTDVLLNGLIINDGDGNIEHHARYTMNINGYLESTPYVTHFSGDYYQMRIPGSTSYWHNLLHFDWGMNPEANSPSNATPNWPRFYFAAGNLGGKAVLVETTSAFEWSFYPGDVTVRPDGGNVRVSGTNNTWLEATLNNIGFVGLTGAFSGQSGNCSAFEVEWNDLDGNLPAAAWNCP